MIQTVIDFYVQRHEGVLKQLLQQSNIPAPLIREATEYCLFPGGKRIRPVLTYLAGALCDVPLPVIDVIAVAIELTHCYSLIHDDLPAMDNDDFRRGKPSCHKQFDEATAILTGDGMQVLAIELLLKHLTPLLNAKALIQVTQELLKASGTQGMISGQSFDLSELSKKQVNEERLQYIHELKTGRLISACFTMVLAAQSNPAFALQNQLLTYAHHLGLVFQIQDDYLDHYASLHYLGKNRASDASNAKSTYASLFCKDELEEKINTHYNHALDCLHAFGDKAHDLITLTIKLRQRSQSQ